MSHIKGQSQLHVTGAPAVPFRGQTLPYCSLVILASCLGYVAISPIIQMEKKRLTGAVSLSRNLAVYKHGEGTEFVMLALKTQKFEWCFQNHAEVNGGRVRPGGVERDCGRSDTSTGVLYSKDAWQKASPGSTPSRKPGCGFRKERGASPEPTQKGSMGWQRLPCPAFTPKTALAWGGQIPHGGKPLCCSFSRLRLLLLQPGSTLPSP